MVVAAHTDKEMNDDETYSDFGYPGYTTGALQVWKNYVMRARIT